MSSDVLQCLPTSSEVVVETAPQPLSTSSTGLPSSPSVSVASDSPSQSSPSSACGSSPAQNGQNEDSDHRTEETCVSHCPDGSKSNGLLAEKPVLEASADATGSGDGGQRGDNDFSGTGGTDSCCSSSIERGERAMSTGRGAVSSLADGSSGAASDHDDSVASFSSSASPVRETCQQNYSGVSDSTALPSNSGAASASDHSYEHASGSYCSHKNFQQQQQRLTANASRPRRLRLNRPFPHRIANNAAAGPHQPSAHRAAVSGDMSNLMYNPQQLPCGTAGLDFSPSSTSSSPLAGYGAPLPQSNMCSCCVITGPGQPMGHHMQPYPLLSGLIYQPSPVNLMAPPRNADIEQQGEIATNGEVNGHAPPVISDGVGDVSLNVVCSDGSNADSASGSGNEHGRSALMHPTPPQHVVQVHVNPGVIFNVRVGDEVHHITGPATVPMVSPTGPPHPLPLQVPPGHVVQQVIDEHGTLRHVILSLQQPAPPHTVFGHPPPANNSTNSGSQMMDGEYMMTSNSSPSHGGVVNGGMPSSGSGGSRTNTPPSPPTALPHHPSHHLSGASSSFQPSPAMPPPAPFALYHTLPHPSFMSHPAAMLPPHPGLAMPPGPPMAGHFQAVSPVSLANAAPQMMQMDGGYQQNNTTSGSNNSVRGYHHRNAMDSGFQTRGYRSNSQPLGTEHGPHVQKSVEEPPSLGQDDSSTEDSLSCPSAMYDISQSSPVILVNGNGAPILVHDGFDMAVPNGAYQQSLSNVGLDQFASSIQQRKSMERTNGSYQMNNGGPRRWRKQPLGNSAMPARLRPSKPQEAPHTDGGDDSSSSGSGAVPSSPRRRGGSIDSSVNKTNDHFKANPDDSASTGQTVPGTNGNEAESENGTGEQAVPPPVELSEEEKERRRLVEAIELALSQLGPPKLINVTATSLTVEMAPLPTDRVIEATGLEAAAAGAVKQNIVYDVSLSVPQRDNQLENIYTGQAAEVNVVDLKPATHYSLGVAALYTGPPVASPSDPIRGAALPLLSFHTQPSVPDRPDPPKLASKNAVRASSIHLRWSPPSCENGSPVTSYVLEWKQGPSLNDSKSVAQTNFTELFRCAADLRQYRVANLQPATLYSFRLAAINAIGQSLFSDEVGYRTSGAPPPPPDAPQLRQAGVSFLTLYWPANVGGAVSSSPMEFTLQMDDLISGHGFLTVYKGADVTEYSIRNLRRNSEYRFRLVVENDDGQSKWSEPIVSYKTLPDAPQPPMKLAVKSAAPKSTTSLSAHSIRLCWEVPRDDGGASIESYEVEATENVTADQPENPSPIVLTTIGAEREVGIEGLQPGRTYKCRVRARGPGGFSGWSDIIIAGTAAICPTACATVPSLHGRAKPTSLAIRWSSPTSDGGAPITSYEVRSAKVTNTKLASPAPVAVGDVGEWQTVYEGSDLTCVVHNLAPGRSYIFQVRAVNKVGPGPWNPIIPPTGNSGPLTFLNTSAAPPDAPATPLISLISAHVICVTWSEPVSNGARITEYRLESSESSFPFLLVYSGTQLSFEAKSLQPATQYSFRLQALNSAGSSPYSPVVSCQTPPAAPSAPTEMSVHSLSSSSFAVEWMAPKDNGSPILSYNISITPGDRLINVPLLPMSPLSTPSTASEEGSSTQQMPQEQDLQQSLEHIVDGLSPDTVYRARVQAVNLLGAGSFSAPVKVTTPPLPPQPPELELVEATHNSLRVRWAPVPPASTVTPGADLVEYTLLMDRPSAPNRLQPVYTGPALSYRATRLQERTSYRFAVQAKTQSGGTGPQSAVPRVFATLPLPPAAPTGLTVNVTTSVSPQAEGEVTKTSALTVTWRPVVPNQSASSLPIEYLLQWTTPSNNSFIQLYRGSETSFTIPSSLVSTGSFAMRIAAAFVLSEEFLSMGVTKSAPQSQIGQFSQAVPFRVNKISSDSVQLLPIGADLPKTAPQSSIPTTVASSKSTDVVASNTAAAFITRLLETVHLRRRVDADNEAWTDTQLAAGFVFAFAILAMVLSYVAHSFLSSTAT